MQNQDNQNLIYLYDLPKDDISSKKLAIVFKERAGVELESRPQIKKDITRPFYSGIVNIKDATQFQTACEKMRYFEVDGKQCRALQFDKQLLGPNKERLMSNNVFVKNIPKDIKNEELEKKFEHIGKVKSLKISLNSDHSSRGYGFICFQEEESAQKAIEFSKNDQQIQALMFQPRDRRELRKLVNNIYVKNIPADMDEAQIRAIFEPYGHIKSIVLMKNDIGQICFVCYDDPKRISKEYGPECANKAIDALNGRDMGQNMKLYLRHALKKADRDIEKKKESLKYKASKKRCNLFVKNFPDYWNEQQLTDLFSYYGDIENLKMERNRQGNFYSFICYKSPDSAAKAKEALNRQMYENKILMVNFYEIKEVRQVQLEEAIDKADFEKYKAQQTGGFKWDSLSNTPNLSQIISELLNLIKTNDQTIQRQTQYYDRRRRPYYYGRSLQQPAPIRDQQAASVAMPGLRSASQNAPPPSALQNSPANVAIANLTPAQKYMLATQKLLPSVTDRNPYIKDQVGHCIYDFVTHIIGADKAPKITGMLIELPVSQIKQYMNSYEALQMKVHEANSLLLAQANIEK